MEYGIRHAFKNIPGLVACKAVDDVSNGLRTVVTSGSRTTKGQKMFDFAQRWKFDKYSFVGLNKVTKPISLANPILTQ